MFCGRLHGANPDRVGVRVSPHPHPQPKAIDEGYDTSVCLLNYRADGTTFWNQFFVASLRDGKGDTVNYVGVQCKVMRGGKRDRECMYGKRGRATSLDLPSSRSALRRDPPQVAPSST